VLSVEFLVMLLSFIFHDKLAIYEYWNKRNRSTLYSTKLDKIFNEAAKLLSQHPTLGPPTNYKDIRVKNLRDYQLFAILLSKNSLP